jgi:hypothetical protein
MVLIGQADLKILVWILAFSRESRFLFLNPLPTLFRNMIFLPFFLLNMWKIEKLEVFGFKGSVFHHFSHYPFIYFRCFYAFCCLMRERWRLGHWRSFSSFFYQIPFCLIWLILSFLWYDIWRLLNDDWFCFDHTERKRLERFGDSK